MTNRCGETIGSNCVNWQGGTVPGVCSPANITDVLNSAIACCNANSEALDMSSIDLGCLYSPTITVWSCPVGQTFVTDPSALAFNGTPGFCQTNTTPPTITLAVPTASTIPNTVPKPTTLAGIIQLIINKVPCCDPCAGPNKTTP